MQIEMLYSPQATNKPLLTDVLHGCVTQLRKVFVAETFLKVRKKKNNPAEVMVMHSRSS